MSAGLRNWAGNHTYVATRVHRPETIAQVRELVARLRLLEPPLDTIRGGRTRRLFSLQA